MHDSNVERCIGVTWHSGTGSAWNMASSTLVEKLGVLAQSPQCSLRGPSSIGGFPCISQPCLNNGTCKDHIRSFSCTCAPGYEGKTCAMGEVPSIPNPRGAFLEVTAASSGTGGCPGTVIHSSQGAPWFPYSAPPWKSCPRSWPYPVTLLSGPTSVEKFHSIGVSSPLS